MTVSLHLCEEKLAFACTMENGEPAPPRILDRRKLHPVGVATFANTNTGSDDFAAGALAMLVLLETTVGRTLNVCHESDITTIFDKTDEEETGEENPTSSEPTP